MTLTSKHFTVGDGAPACQRCQTTPAAHITKGQRGPQVRKIQAALAAITGASFDDYDVAYQFYGQSTADAVLDYKTNHNPPIINQTYQKAPDNIVGQMTIAALDRDMKALEGGDSPPSPQPTPPQPKPPTPPSPKPPQPAPPAPSKLDRALFVPIDELQGFDPSPGPVKVKGEGFQAVPLGGDRTVRLIGSGDTDASGFKVSTVDTAGRTVTHIVALRENTPSTAPERTFQISGSAVGGVRLEATDLDGTLVAALQIAVLPPKQLTIRFHNVSDSAGHVAKRVQGSDIFDWIKAVNRIWFQAAISVRSSGFSDLAISGNAGDAVDSRGELLIIAEAAKAGFGGLGLSERRVFFVWDISDDQGTTTAGDTPGFGPIIFIDQNQPPQAGTLSHEIGHSLKLQHTKGDQDNLMIEVSDPGERPRLLTKAQILAANPPQP